ncbi:MAG: hypothetical protein P4L92_17865 [Rudaea sp.]|nr:hypothetical protein [Rudaea sp.]
MSMRLGGWWRLWIVLSGLWAIGSLGLAIFLYTSVRMADQVQGDSIQWACDLVPLALVSPRKEPIKLSSLSLEQLQRLVTNEQQMAWGDPSTWGAFESHVQECIVAKKRDYQSEQSKERLNVAVLATAFVLAPPTLALVIGLLCRWIFVGFTTTKDGNKN